MTIWVQALIVALIFGAGWGARAVVAENGMLTYKEEQRVETDKEQKKTVAVEVADTQNTAQSTVSVDAGEAQQRVEIQYVDREVIKYRDRLVAGKCVLPAEWVRLYNASGRQTGQLPKAAPAGPSVDGSASSVR